ncbi:MAG: hypothetical protein EBS53_12200, partial [Bacteroidetes bacterium]|nr:hypothetical protein [Bacteroidota bacterium]
MADIASVLKLFTSQSQSFGISEEGYYSKALLEAGAGDTTKIDAIIAASTDPSTTTAIQNDKSAAQSGGGGTIVGASNVGTAGEGLYDSTALGVLNFRNISAGSSKVTVSLDGPNKEVEIDVDESQIDVKNLLNVTAGSNAFASWNQTQQLQSVPGFTFDDDGALRIGAQNSITIPPGLTDYYSISISPTLSNAITNVFGVWLNSPLTAAVSNYYAFTVNGYGTGAPGNYKAFESNSSYTGTGVDASHFNANSSWDVTGTITGFKLFASGD